MNQPEFCPPDSNTAAFAVVKSELSSKRRWIYRIMLVIVTLVFAALLSLWITEPRPLPLRLDVSFAAMLIIAAGWVGVLSWILMRKDCPTAEDRIATSWMAWMGCLIMFVVAAVITATRGNLTMSLGIALVGVPVVGSVGMMVRAAYRRRSDLQAKLRELECTN